MDVIKFICIKDIVIERCWDESEDIYKKGEIYYFVLPDSIHYMNYKSPGNYWLTNIEAKNFETLAEFREKRIDSIFS